MTKQRKRGQLDTRPSFRRDNRDKLAARETFVLQQKLRDAIASFRATMQEIQGGTR